MHWSITTAKNCLARGDDKVVIETGTSISGIPHLGNASDVIRGECVRKAVLRQEGSAELIWIADDSDPFRSIPKGMEAVSDYLGFPVKDIPDPAGCHDSFVDHYAQPFLESLKEFGVNPKVYSGTEIYRTGGLVEQTRIALSKRVQITEILNKFRDNKLPDDYIPYTPICKGCGKISTTQAISVNGDIVKYKCVDKEVTGGEVTGCGFEGEADITKGNGKLPWRVEWAARWAKFQVSCEPFGKDHAAAGGSYSTSKIITKEIFGHIPPIPVIYEFLTLNGEKISSSKGNVITPTGWLEIAEPEVLNYFMFKKLNKQRDIQLSRMASMVDEYDIAEKQYFENPDADNEHYLLSQVGEPTQVNIPFTLCAVLAQVVPNQNPDIILEKIKTQGYENFDNQKLLKRVSLAGVWVKNHGPDFLNFTLNTPQEIQNQLESIQENEKNALSELVGALDGKISSSDFHKKIYDVARANDLEPPQLFKAIYQTLISKDKGPKAAAFLLALDKKFLQECFQ